MNAVPAEPRPLAPSPGQPPGGTVGLPAEPPPHTRRVGAGASAWAAWYEANAHSMIRFATFVTGANRAADVVQVAMVRALGARVEPDDRRAYVNRIIVREAQRLREREKRRSELELHVVPLPVSDDGEPRPELRAAVRALSPQQRAVVFHTYWEDLTPAQVGRLLGCSEGAVKRQLARARAKLRRVLS